MENKKTDKESMTLKGHLKDFGLRTSMKGVPRVLKSETKLLVSVWLIATICLASFLTWQVYNLLSRYFNYGVVTTTASLSMNDEELREYFPAVTLCNLYPFASQNVPGVPTYKEYLEVIGDKQAKNEISSSYVQLSTLSAYFQYIGAESAERVGHSKDNFISMCSFLNKNNSQILEQPCDVTRDVNLRSESQFFNCYTVHAQDDIATVGVTVTVYLDDFKNDISLDDHPEEQSSGVVLHLHRRNSTADLRMGLHIPPGVHQKVLLGMEKFEKMGPPYSGCEEVLDNLYDLEGYPSEYTFFMCLEATRHKSIAEACQCNLLSQMVYFEPLNRSLPFCEDAKLNSSVLNEQLDCVAKQSLFGSPESTLTCAEPCSYVKYDIEHTSGASWPHLAQHAAFYQNHIKNKPYASRFVVYEHVINASKNGQHSVAWQLLKDNRDLIKDNFLKVNCLLRGS
jgi:hypothetical protein